MYKTAFLLIVFSGFFINFLPISPIYLFFTLSFVGLFLQTLKIKKLVFNSLIGITMVLLCYLLVTQLMIIPEKTNALYNVILSLIYFVFSFQVLYSLSSDKILNISVKFINISILLVIIETIWRLTHPWQPQTTWQFMQVDSSFYKYKMNSIMYQDSNFVGIFIVALFFFCIYLRRYQAILLKWQMFMLTILCVLTFSRAAIFTLIAFYILIGFKTKIMKILLSITAIITGATFIFGYMNSDISFLSKIEIVDRAFEFLSDTTMSNVLLGIGFGNSFEYLRIGAHNFMITYLLESGLIGFILLFVLWWRILKKTKFKAGIVMLPFLLAGMSLAGHAITYLYCIFAIIYILEKKHASNEKNSNPLFSKTT